MNKDLQSILNIIQRSEHLDDEEKNSLLKAANIVNKELEIESSLERVRTVAMSMNKPDDMLDVCRTISDQLELLNVKEIRNVQTAIFYKEKGTYMNYEYYAKHHKTFITETTYTDHKIQQDFAEKMLKGNGEFMVAHIEGDEVKAWIAYQKTTNVFIDDYLNTASSVNYYWFSLGPVALGTSTYVPLTEEETNLFKRFLKVFELSYRRYLDIEKAEIQAKEAQIENALEKVRSRSLAMHTSDELGNVVSVAFQKLKELGVGIDGGVTINILKEGTRDLMIWGAAPYLLEKVQCIFIPYFDHRILTAPWDASDKGLELFTTKYSFEEKNVFYKYVFEHTGFKNLPDEAKDFILSAPCIVQSVGLAKHSSIAIYSYEDKMFSDFENDVLKRFAKVFEQAYVRFLDLQKAEAQAKEAKIEAALERVRAQAMSIRKSEELAGVGEIIFEQLKSLGFSDLRNTEILINNDNKESIISYYYSDYGITGNIKVFYKKNPTVQLWVNELKKANGAFAAIEISENEMDAWRKYREEIGYQPDPKLNAAKTVFYYSYSTGLGALSISSFTKISDDQIKTLERFRNVFGLAYRRYADVAQAEAQAREAQIELALERVRARTMAMQKSDELAETASLLFKQLIGLGIKSTQMRTCAITTLRSDEPIGECWITKPDGDIIPRSFMVPYNETSAYKTIYAAWKNGEKFLVVNLSGDALIQHLNFLKKYAKIPTQQFQALPDQPTETFTHAMFFSQGYLFIISNEPLPEYHDIFKRFGAIFQQTYTRFLDLQKAEAQARESQIEAALERVRSRSMAMQKSEELKEVIRIVYDQFIHLNINVDHAGFVVDHKLKSDWHFWIADKNDIPSKITTPYFDSAWGNDFNKAKEKGSDFFATNLNFEEKNKFYTELLSYVPGLPEESKKFYLSCPGLAGSTVLFEDVSLYIENFSGIPYSDEENKILLRFGKVFQQTYTRFLDLQKAEAQAKEAQIEAALEKVRSRTLAMQRSDELAETAAEVFKQLIGMGIEPNRLYIGIINGDTRDMEMWATDEDGTRVGKKFTFNAADNASVKKLYDGWAGKIRSVTVDMQGTELENYISYLKQLQIPLSHALTQKRRVQSVAYFDKGFIGMASPDDQSENSIRLLERFASVFNLTFTRFNDLKIAEAHAFQAEQDLIEIKAARKKAEETLGELQATQTQLIQSEKMASLGELTAGIAHEIQNPLNFVNNFSEVSNELIEELQEERNKANGIRDEEMENEILNDIKQNLEKINHHGKRADAIVKGMLQHSRSSAGEKEPTDINALADEYLRLSYQGLRAKNKNFNSAIKTDLDKSIGKINIIPQDIGRVLLNLYNNAFYAVNEKKPPAPKGEHESPQIKYEPTVTVTTRSIQSPSGGRAVEIKVIDNGGGIPQKVVDKIFQPFFTTKPTGQGTGLGLSLSYDIIKAHGGEIKVETKEGEGSEFRIELLLNTPK